MGTSATVNIRITARGQDAQNVIDSVRRSLGQLAGEQARSTRQANEFGVAIRNLRNQLFALGLVIKGAQFFGRLIGEGVRFNQVVETGTLAIATLITATSRLVSSEGRVLVGAEALAEGMKFASDQVNKLRVDGLRTAATTEQLIDAFQQATAAGLSAGLTLDQIRRTTVQIVLAAGNLGIPMNQLNQEVRSILEATIDRNSRVAKILGITNAQVKLQREQGTLAQFLNQKLQAFSVASEKAADTWAVIRSNMTEALQVLAGDVTKPFFDSLKRGIKSGFLDQLFDFDRAAVSKAFSGLVEGGQAFFAEFGRIVESSIAVAVRGAQNLSEWFSANRAEVQLFVAELGETARAIGGLIVQVVRVLGGITKWAIESGTFNAVLDGVQVALKTIARVIDVLIVGAILKATGVLRVFNTLLGGQALLQSAKALGGAWKIGFLNGFLKPIGMAQASVAVLFNTLKTGIKAALVALGPFRIALAAVGVAATIYTILENRQKVILAQKAAMLRALASEKAAVTALSREYVEQSQGVLDGTAIDQDLVTTLKTLATISDDLAKKNDSFSASAAKHSIALRKMSDDLAGNVRARENLRVEQQKLEGALRQTDLKSADRIRFQTRLKTITSELAGFEKQYHDMIKLVTAAIRDNTEAHVEAAKARVLAAFAERNAAKHTVDQLKEQRLALSNSLLEVDIGQRPGINARISNLTKQIDELESTLPALAEGFGNARDELDKLLASMGKGRTTIQPLGDSPDEKTTARESNLKKQIDAEIELVRAREKRITAELKEQLDANEISIEEFAAATLKAHTDAIQDIIVLRRRLINELSKPGDVAQQQGEINELAEEQKRVVAENSRELLKLRRDLTKDELEIQREFLEATGQLAAAANIDIERKYGEMIERLRANKSPFLEIALRLKGQAEVKAGIEQVFNTVELHQQRLDSTLANIQSRAAQGILGPRDAHQETIRAYQEMQQQIEIAASTQAALFAITGNPAHAAAIAKLTENWNENAAAIANAREGMREFQLAIFAAVESGFVEFLTADITKLDQLDNAFRAMATSIVQSIRRMIAEIIAFKAVSAIMGAFGVGAAVGGAPFGGQIPGVWAQGGFIRGLGSETSDSIPARLSRGEYVLSARTVRSIGVNLLDQLNFGASRPRLRKRRNFASGGLVETEALHGARGELSATIALEAGLVLKHLSTSAGLHSLLKIVAKNPRAFQAALSAG